MADKLLEVKDLKMYFYTRDGVVKAVDGVSYDLEPGQTLGVVGESGSGKSVTALTLMRSYPMPPGKVEGGEVLFRGKSLLDMKEDDVRKIRGNDIAMIFQDPMTSLNPVYRIGHQIAEALMLHKGMSKKQAHGALGRAARARRHPQGQGAPQGLPAPVLRWHAPARDDRHGAVVRSGDSHRR